MNGNLNPEIIDNTLRTLEKRCLILLCEGYKMLLSQKKISIDWKEEDISKELILCLEPNENRRRWRISIAPEHRFYTDKIPAKESPRIDFCFSGWTDVEWKYYSEAKILIESDSYKKGRRKKISAHFLHKRYIETGIDHYLSGWYPSDCLSGYILQGKTENIINCINQFLRDCDREKEVLTKQPFELPYFDSLYLSRHKNGFSIKHLIFDFVLPD
ncbi:MAG: hypothetical protein LBL13_00095 [Bacteroidales bacterium]|jgi:hypothetical protein|nr:hypothetical protein [Bacteroidales bacterium]